MISAGGACIDVVTENDVVRVLPNLRTLWLMKSPSGVLETNSSSREKIGTTAEDEAALGLAGMVISEVAMKVAMMLAIKTATNATVVCIAMLGRRRTRLVLWGRRRVMLVRRASTALCRRSHVLNARQGR